MIALVSFRAYWRFLLVVKNFFPLLWAWARDRRRFVLLGGRRQVDSETRVHRAEVLLDTLLTLGPTFIKLGQLLSTRPDVLPPEYVDVLSSLQDEVPPADWEAAREVVEAELGPVALVYDEFDPDPMSGASLGQVHRAIYEGDEVAVKIRRPGIEPLVEADLRVVRWSLPLLVWLIDDARSFSLSNLANEFAKTIRQEMDYNRERAMLEEISGNFEGDESIRIPETHPEVSGETVLTMEHVPGTKITKVDALDEMGVDRTELAERLQRIYLKMIIDDGVFHADPHPGNLSVAADGTIIFYDFGMSGRVEPYIQERIVDFYVSVAERDIDGILDALIAMGTLSPEADREVMGQVMELAIQDARGEDIEQYRVQQIIDQVESTIYEFPLRLPRNLALVLRVATVVEGVCVSLDPEFDFIRVATAYLTEQGYREETVRRVAEDLGNQLRDTTEAMVSVPPKLDRVLTRFDNESITVNVNVQDEDDALRQFAARIVLGIFIAVGVLSAAIVYSFGDDWPVALTILVATMPVAYLLRRSFKRRTSALGAKPQFTRQNLRERRGR